MSDKVLFRTAVTVASLCIIIALWLFAVLADVLVMEVTNDADVFLSELDELGWQNVQRALVIDMVFPILYVLVSLLAIDASARRYNRNRLREARSAMRATAIAAGVFDLFENAFLLIAIGSGPGSPDDVATVPLYLSSLFSYLKWLGLAVVIAYAAPPLVRALWQSLTRRDGGVSQAS